MVEVKKHWKSILAIGAIVIFIFQIIGMGVLGGGGFGGESSGGETETGMAEFSGMIRTYDPFLVVVSEIDEDTIEELRGMEGVDDISPSPDGMMIKTETRDDVYPVGVYLRERNITALAVANIAVPSVIEVEFASGSVENASAGNFAVRLATEPLVDVDTSVTVRMIAEIDNGMIVGYGSPVLVSEDKEIEVDAAVLEAEYIHTYLIPWHERNNVSTEDLEGYGTVQYEKKNSVLFNQPLTMDGVMEKKNLDYVEYIDQYSIECDEYLTNVTQIENDFGQNITFPDSILTIVSNETLELGYAGSVLYSYVVLLPDEADGIVLEANEMELESEDYYNVNSTIRLKITGTVIGGKMVAVKSIETG